MTLPTFISRATLAATALAAGLVGGSASAAVTTIYANDFDGNSTLYPGITGGFGPYVNGTANGAYAGAGGKSWAGNFLQNITAGNPAGATTFTFNNLPTHTSITFDFMLGFIDSWDSLNGSPSPDELRFFIDGNLVATLTSATASGNVSNHGGGTQVVDNGQIDSHFFFSDDLVDMATASFLTLNHVASSVTLTIQAGGAGWQGGADESWGLDSFRLTAVTPDGNGVPVPAPLALMGLGLMGAGISRRLRRD